MSLNLEVLAPWIILIAVGLYGLVHSILASLTVKDLAGRWLGTWGRRGYRLGYNFFAMFSFLPVLALVNDLPDLALYSIPFPWMLLTLALQGLAVVALILGVTQAGTWSFVGFQQLTQTAAGSDKPEGSSSMTVSGLYRWVRHPIYTGVLVFIWCAPIMTRNLAALNLGLTLYILVGAWFEERKLVHEFGQEYQIYAKKTPMLVPGLIRPGGHQTVNKD